jgi:hypothetical protein
MKRSLKYFATPALAVLLGAAAANAQQIIGQVNALTLNGMPVSFPEVMTPGLGDLAKAGNGVVLVDPAISQTGFEFQQYLLAHESGHLVGLPAETSADAYAGRLLKIAGFTPTQMQVVYSGMLQFLSPVGDATHPPSPARVEIVRSAYEGQ